MQIERKDIELLAPAGSFESLMAAIQGGANAVYFGLGKLNMRARSAGNFTVDDLPEIMHICNENHIRAYLTLNIVFYDQEMEEMRKTMNLAKKHKITAIIASDQAVIGYARSKGMEVHISTQVNISNMEAVKFYAAFADVMVLARELNIEQVKEIHRQIEIQQIKGPSGELVKLEMFIHGALCMSISGKCYLSLHEHNHAANRGDCYQDCRKSYTVTEKETGRQLDIVEENIMSPKDLCTIHFLNKLLDAGVRVLKIEGRARSPEYVKAVSACYNEAIQAYLDNTFTKEKIEKWREKLATVFNRGFWDGYYLGQRLGEWSEVYGSKATKRKIYIGKCLNYFDKIQVAEFLCETGDLSLGDKIFIIGPTTGVIETSIQEIRVDLKSVEKTSRGDRFSIPVKELTRRSDKLYKVVDASQIKKQ